MSSAIAALSFVKATGDFSNDSDKNRMISDDLNTIDASLTFINDLLRNMLDMHKAANNQMVSSPLHAGASGSELRANTLRT